MVVLAVDPVLTVVLTVGPVLALVLAVDKEVVLNVVD